MSRVESRKIAANDRQEFALDSPFSKKRLPEASFGEVFRDHSDSRESIRFPGSGRNRPVGVMGDVSEAHALVALDRADDRHGMMENPAPMLASGRGNRSVAVAAVGKVVQPQTTTIFSGR